MAQEGESRSEADDGISATARQILQETLAEHYQTVRLADEFERAIVEELDDLSPFVARSDTRTLCILMVSFLEDTLKRNFIRLWHIKGGKGNEAFFGSNGPLSSFSQRILVASALSWLSPGAAAEATTLRKIRNLFAHDHKVHSLTEAPLCDLAANLRPLEATWDRMEGYGTALAVANQETIFRLRVFCSATLIAAQSLSSSKMLDQGLGALQRPSGYRELMEVEQRIMDITIRHCFDVVGADWRKQIPTVS